MAKYVINGEPRLPNGALRCEVEEAPVRYFRQNEHLVEFLDANNLPLLSLSTKLVYTIRLVEDDQ